MVKVQVLGHGMIPRGKGIAPRLEPFEADKKLIGLMLGQGGLIVKIYNPHTGKFDRCKYANYERMYDSYEAAAKEFATPRTTKGLQVQPEEIKPVQVKANPVEVNNAIKSAFEIKDTVAKKEEPVKSEPAKSESIKNEPVAEALKEINTEDKNLPKVEEKKDKWDKKDKKKDTFKPINNPENKD